jgi:hypothetical protein
MVVLVQIPENHDVSKECLDLIRRMLVKNPRARITLQEIKVSVGKGSLFSILSEEKMSRDFFSGFQSSKNFSCGRHG